MSVTQMQLKLLVFNPLKEEEVRSLFLLMGRALSVQTSFRLVIVGGAIALYVDGV
jgi:hypothetical protein